jgi:hypothetical protein
MLLFSMILLDKGDFRGMFDLSGFTLFPSKLPFLTAFPIFLTVLYVHSSRFTRLKPLRECQWWPSEGELTVCESEKDWVQISNRNTSVSNSGSHEIPSDIVALRCGHRLDRTGGCYIDSGVSID